jgi:glutamate synthase domain-containing protein 1/glutamate synthase domain-containing protein 3
MKNGPMIDSIINSRVDLLKLNAHPDHRRAEAEGGCGVIGVASSMPMAGRHIIGPVSQMCNRGNGKGGGLAVVGCFPELKNQYALNVAYLNADARRVVEEKRIAPFFDIAHIEEQAHVEDYHEFPRMELEPPSVVRYFSRVKPNVLRSFAEKYAFDDGRAAEDEFVFQNSYRLNREFYADLDDKAAFILSHGRNMMILKAVGYCEDIARYYQIEDLMGYVWIGHQRYPTRGRVWHPGGAHPFSGMDEALVHNGDFANYYGVCEYLKPRGYEPLFLTDTEVSAYLFDLYHRVYDYPMEYLLEALAPTTEHDFDMLPREKKGIYRAIQRAHLHGSPDGPWFFIIARNDVKTDTMQLIGITDTSMLRPQVFSIQETEDDGRQVSIGVIASEKQAIDALFQSLAREDSQITPMADQYWNARGGSYSDGGAFVFSVTGEDGSEKMICTDKFGRRVVAPSGRRTDPGNGHGFNANLGVLFEKALTREFIPHELFREFVTRHAMAHANFNTLRTMCDRLVHAASGDEGYRERALEFLTLLNDLRYDCGDKKRSSVLAILRAAADEIMDRISLIPSAPDSKHSRITFETREKLKEREGDQETLFIDARGFTAEGDTSVARLIVCAYQFGWRRVVVYRCKGDRFIGCGLGAGSDGVRIDVYGSSGDYLGSGLDGAEIYVHDDAQDQVGQILKRGKIVIYGMVGQTFLYGAKGGEVFVMGNAAGRPLINAVGRVRAIINGSCLDYCAESFMAGAEIDGGFVIINGIGFDEHGKSTRLEQPYPGGNFFSLASGGAGYVNDPHHKLTESQLNQAEFVPFTDADSRVIEPYLRENELIFGIGVNELLEGMSLSAVYRKVVAAKQDFTSRGVGHD